MLINYISFFFFQDYANQLHQNLFSLHVYITKLWKLAHNLIYEVQFVQQFGSTDS